MELYDLYRCESSIFVLAKGFFAQAVYQKVKNNFVVDEGARWYLPL